MSSAKDISGVDTTMAMLKLKGVKRQLALTAPTVMAHQAQMLYDAMAKNLKGPNYGTETGPRGGVKMTRGPRTGMMPIPRISTTLASSTYIIPLGSVTWVVGVDNERCPYAVWVHDGTKYMEGREFLGDPKRELEPAMRKAIRAEIIAAIRLVGRA